jgi:uncharacterized protein (TIGR04141 family)
LARKSLTLHLAKPDVGGFRNILSDAAQERLALASTRIIEVPDFADGAILYVFVGEEGVPGWLRDLRVTFNVPGRIHSSSACAVLAFRTNNRIFASTFAHGWTYLNEENIEGDFGLRVSLNGLNEKKLKRLERANLGDALRAISQSPFQREFTSFGLDDSLDLIRRLSGQAKEESSAETMSGSKSLKVSGDYEIEDLSAIATEALALYESNAYQASSFKIVDFVNPITDSRLIASLDELAAQSIKENRDEFELGLPIGYHDDGITYRFAGPGLRGSYPDLLLRHYIEALGEKLDQCTAKMLKEHKIVAIFEDDAPAQKWSVRSSLVGSLVHQDERYAINEGAWYALDEAFKASIEQAFAELREEWDEPPTPLRKIYEEDGSGRYQTEATYNAEWAHAAGYVLLDTHEIEIPGVRRSRFEPCDLLDIAGKRFIHVKKSSRRSNILSHFFKQGSNSGQQFKRFPAAWGELRSLVRQRAGSQTERRLRQAMKDRNKNWKIEFVIADSPRANGEFNIPFFSKISLRDEVLNLRAMGYSVGLRFIGLPPDQI